MDPLPLCAAVAVAGAVEMAAVLHARRLPWAIVASGTTAVSTARLAAVGVASPSVLVTADDVSAGKPSPDPYLTAAERLGVDPPRCVVLEDAPSGIRAGNAAGTTTVAVTTSHAPDALTGAAHRISTVAALSVHAAEAATARSRGRIAIDLACLVHTVG